MVTVHPNALKHGLTEQEVEAAWENYVVGAVRVPGEVEVRIGVDPSGRDVEMVGSLIQDSGWLVYHAMRPPTKKVRREIERGMRRR